ncbi:putative UbiE/COQ5 family methyltransferase [Tuber magnatum]|uniref:Arsenite methyltransferase n=1 Tax=Tuber magnatum TaxID=42249 RepID=A0A317STN3_9PEZI|nr:putative UbiE/COQ5 family methyltransferase [Tuber magnatum]
MAATSAQELIQSYYGKYAKANTESTDLSAYSERVASAFGYSAKDLASLPGVANLGVSCGNPLATANLKEGEIVIDLGSGGGLDVFIAARKVGPKGKAIGIDITQEMIDLANKNATLGCYTNHQVKSNITSTPQLPPSTADVITSNCVINLLPHTEKPLVFTEIYRLLKPGGRVAISDILAKKELPEEFRADATLYVGCISGTSLTLEYEEWMRGAGFEDVLILDTNKDLNVYKEGMMNETEEGVAMANKSCCTPEAVTSCCSVDTAKAGVKININNYDFNEWVGAFQIYAIKPAHSE